MANAKYHLAAAVVFSILVTAFFQTLELEEYGAEDGLQLERSVFDDKLKKLIESFRQNMSQPLDSLGLPALDPFHQDKMHVNLEFSGIRATGELMDLNIVGLSTFVIDRVAVKIVGLHLLFRFFLAELTVTTQLNVTVADTLHLSGPNTLTLTGDDLTLSGDIALAAYTTGKKNLYLKNVTLDFSYGAITVDLGDGFNADDRLTKAVQSVVNDLLPQILDRKKKDLLKWADKEVMSLGNHLLENTTLADLISGMGY